jgi:hypothetical protein
MYCAEDGCLCWNRYAIARQNPGSLTLERKPARKSLSQRMAESGFTRRPTHRSLPKDD